MVHDTQDESAIGLAAVGFIVVVMAIILGKFATQGNQTPGPGPGDAHEVQQKQAAPTPGLR